MSSRGVKFAVYFVAGCFCTVVLLSLVIGASEQIGSRITGLYQLTQTGVDVTAASGTFNTLDIEDATMCIFVADLTAIAGGTSPTVTAKAFGSWDGTTFFFLEDGVAQSSASAVDDIQVAGTWPRYVRLHWATTGTPTTATMDVYYACKR